MPSGEDTSNFFPAPSNDNRGFVPSRIFSTSSMTLERLSLSTMVAASGALVLRRDRAKSPRETAPSCAIAQRGSISPTKANATQKQPLYLMKIRPREPTLSLQILVRNGQKNGVTGQTMVVALPRQGSGRAKEKARASGTIVAHNGAPHARATVLQQARGTKTSNWIRQRHGLPLKNPTSHRKPQRRIAQMNDSHILTPRKMLCTLGEAHCCQGSKPTPVVQRLNGP